MRRESSLYDLFSPIPNRNWVQIRETRGIKGVRVCIMNQGGHQTSKNLYAEREGSRGRLMVFGTYTMGSPYVYRTITKVSP